MIATIHSIQYHDESNYRDGRNYCYESNYSICNVMSVMSCCFIVEFSCMYVILSCCYCCHIVSLMYWPIFTLPWQCAVVLSHALSSCHIVTLLDFQALKLSRRFIVLLLPFQATLYSRIVILSLGLTLEFLSYNILENFMRNEFRISRKNAPCFAKFLFSMICISRNKTFN